VVPPTVSFSNSWMCMVSIFIVHIGYGRRGPRPRGRADRGTNQDCFFLIRWSHVLTALAGTGSHAPKPLGRVGKWGQRGVFPVDPGLSAPSCAYASGCFPFPPPFGSPLGSPFFCCHCCQPPPPWSPRSRLNASDTDALSAM
jgi:hypothetical protein